VDTLKHARQAAVAARRQEEERRIAPALQLLQETIAAAQGRCSELDAAIAGCPRARMLLMAARRPGGLGSRLLRWLQAGLMSLGAVAAVLMAVALFGYCKMRWVGLAAKK
jgi:hypothetical protein